MIDRLSDRFAPLADENPSAEWAELAKLTDALLKDGKATPTPLGFEYVAEASGNLPAPAGEVEIRGHAARSRATRACRGPSPRRGAPGAPRLPPPLGLPGLRPGF